MARFILTWNPVPTATSQIIHYREKGSPTWLTLDTVDGQLNIYQTGVLLDNTMYEFQIEDNDVNNTFSNIDEAIVLVCPVLTATDAGTTLNFSFPIVPTGDIDRIIVRLLKDGLFHLYQTYNAPLSSPISGSFTNLSTTSMYQVRLEMYSGSFFKYCIAQDVDIECIKPTDIVGTII